MGGMTTLGAGKYPAIAAGGWAGPSTNLTHRWALDSTNGATDLVGSINGTIGGSGVTNTTGPSGSANTAKAFAGVTDATSYISFASQPLVLNGAASFFTWVKVTNVTASGAGGDMRMVNLFTDASNGLMFHKDTSTGILDITLLEAANDFGRSTNSAVLVSNTWHHIGWTRSGTGATIKVYVDGTEIIAVGGPQGAGYNTGYVLGDRSAGSQTWEFVGAMAQVVAYNAELTSGQVTTLYGAF